MASLELVDTPGLSRSHEGSAARLAMIREAGCLVLVIDAYGRTDPKADLESFDADLILADMEIVSNRIKRVEESLRKPLPRMEHEVLQHEQATLKTVLAALERGKPLRESDMTDDQLKVTRSFRLFGEKPRVVIFNTADDEAKPERFTSLGTPETPVLAVPAGLELELAKMSPEDRAEFQKEMGVGGTDRDAVIRTLLTTSRQRLFLTAGEKEVRTWLLPSRRHRPGRRRRDPHRPGPGVHPRRDLRLSRSGAAGQRTRSESRAPRAAGAEGIRHPGRRYTCSFTSASSLETCTMTKNPILDELRETRERLLAEAGGTLDGLVAQLQRDELRSDRAFVRPKSRTNQCTGATKADVATVGSQSSPPGDR